MALELKDLLLEKGDFSLTADLSLEAGSLTSVLGPSGAGKSTLFDGLAGFLEPNRGSIGFDGLDLAGLEPGQRPIAVLFQDNNLFPHLTAGQNIGLALSHKRRLSKADAASVDAVLERVDLGGLAGRSLSELSGGQLSRVSLARMLLLDRPIWLLDEPFSALGPSLKRDMLALVKEMADEVGATVLMITHDPSDALALSDSAILVADNKVDGPFNTTALLADPPEALRRYL